MHVIDINAAAHEEAQRLLRIIYVLLVLVLHYPTTDDSIIPVTPHSSLLVQDIGKCVLLDTSASPVEASLICLAASLQNGSQKHSSRLMVAFASSCLSQLPPFGKQPAPTLLPCAVSK